MAGFLCFSSPPSDPGGKPDRIVPLSVFDDTVQWKCSLLYSTLFYDHVLDPDRLRDALDRLVRREGWAKLGARLQRGKPGGRLEYHIPAEFTPKRPALAFSVDRTHANTRAADHPLARKIPRPAAADRAAVVADPDELAPLQRPADGPRRPGDYIDSDRPLLGLHIVAFADATVVTMYWPHCAFDILGQRAMIDAWTLMLEGRDDEVAAPAGVYDDPLGASLGTTPIEPHRLADRQASALGLLGYGLRQMPDLVLGRIQHRMVHVPGRLLDEIREAAERELAAASPTGKPPFISDGDLLFAWWQRLVVAGCRYPRDSGRTVSINYAMSLRGVLAGDILPPAAAATPFLSNALGFVSVVHTARDVLAKPLSHSALLMRTSVREQATRAQVETVKALERSRLGRLAPLFGDSGMVMMTISNWCKARMFDINLSAALAGGGGETGEPSKKKVCPSYIMCSHPPVRSPHTFLILGRDHDGGYWLTGYMAAKSWEVVTDRLRRDQGMFKDDPENSA